MREKWNDIVHATHTVGHTQMNITFTRSGNRMIKKIRHCVNTIHNLWIVPIPLCYCWDELFYLHVVSVQPIGVLWLLISCLSSFICIPVANKKRESKKTANMDHESARGPFRHRLFKKFIFENNNFCTRKTCKTLQIVRNALCMWLAISFTLPHTGGNQPRFQALFNAVAPPS